MRLAKYARAARRTAIYPIEQCINYPVLGLAGEAGELIVKIIDDAGDEAVRKEIGDVLWYIANTAIDCNIQMHELVDGAETFAGVEATGMLPNAIQFVRLAVEVGAVCELAKKLHRDDGSKMTPERRENIRAALGKVLFRLAAIVKFRGWSLGEIARENIVKLASRQGRETLTGDGDNR